MRMPRPTSWWAALAALVAIRLAIPLAAYAASGSALPGLPRFARSASRGGLEGDANGFYDAAREFIGAWARMPRPVLAIAFLATLGAAWAIAVLWRRRPDLRPWLVPASLFAFGLVVCVDIHWQHASGAAVFGWPLVWGLVLLPYRILFGLTPSAAWDVGLGLSLLFVGATVVAVAYLGRYATGRRWAGLLAAALWTSWPVLVGLIAGHRAWANGQWDVDVGLHLYDEPLSTLLVTAGAALVLSPRLTGMRLALAGCALGVATSVKVSNALIAAAALAIVFLRGPRRESLTYLAGALAFAPVVLVYWPLSYPTLFDNARAWPRDPFDPSHFVSSWTESSIFTPHTLAILGPPAIAGLFAMRRPYALALVLALVLVNPVFYSFYANTAQHPRFLYASVPALLVLWAGAVALLLSIALRLRARPAPQAAPP